MTKNNEFSNRIKVVGSQLGTTKIAKSIANEMIKITDKNRFVPRRKQRSCKAQLREIQKKEEKHEKIIQQAEKKGKKMKDDRICIKMKAA